MRWQSQTITATVIALGIAARGPVAGQIYEGWVLVQSNAAYDYLLADVPPTALSSDFPGESMIRVTISRMLVRQVDRERLRLIAERRRLGARTAGYEEYASMTELIDVECSAGQYSVREHTDFDRNGTILDRQSFDRSWTAVERNTPMAGIIRHACGRMKRGRRDDPTGHPQPARFGPSTGAAVTEKSGRWDSNPRHPAWKAGALAN